MTTRYQFVDDSGETRLAGFLVPEPGGSLPATWAVEADGGLTITPTGTGDNALDVQFPVDGIFRLRGTGALVVSPSTILGTDNSLEVTDAGGNNSILVVTGDAKIGFFNHAPVAQPTGVAVSAAGIHAALVALGLITA